MDGYVPIEELDFFRDLEALADEIWERVAGWLPFARDTLGAQLVKSLDSVGANCAEGDGRYSERDSLNFLNIAKGSAREARYWLRRAGRRNLLSTSDAQEYVVRLESVMRRLSALVSSRRKKYIAAKELNAPYGVEYSSSNDPIT